MVKGNTKLFLDKPKLYQMVNLRINGLSYVSLAEIFGCDWTSIKYLCHLYYIKPQTQVFGISNIITQIIPKPEALTYKIVNGEKINLGKSYKEYVRYPHG